MADLGGTFDANGVEPATPAEPIPAGKYLAQIVESEMVETKDKKGKFLKLVFRVIDGPAKGRKCTSRLNLINQNRQTVEIAQRELSAVSHSVGVMVFRDSAALHDIPLAIDIGLEKRSDNGAMANVIKGYEKKDVMLAPSAVAAPQATTNAPPWQR